MPHILVVTENPQEARRKIVYRERIAPSDLESQHFSGQLVERVGWAVGDADRIEHSPPALESAAETETED
jgi:hypothetical protein